MWRWTEMCLKCTEYAHIMCSVVGGGGYESVSVGTLVIRPVADWKKRQWRGERSVSCCCVTSVPCPILCLSGLMSVTVRRSPPSRPAATLIELRNNEANSHADSTAPNGIPKDTLYLWMNSTHTINAPCFASINRNTKLYYRKFVFWVIHIHTLHTHLAQDTKTLVNILHIIF